MKIVEIDTGLFPDAPRVDTALTTLEPTRPGKDRRAWISGQLKTVIHDLQETLHRLRPPH